MSSNPEMFGQTFLENRFLLENIQGGIVYSDFNPPFNLRYVTEGMSVLSGYTLEELLGMKQMDLVCDDDTDFLANQVERQFSEGDTFTVEYRLKRKDGSFVYVLDRAKAVEHEDGNKYIHCLLTDITDLKLLEHALFLSQEKYKLAIEQSGNVIVEFDFKNKLLHFSDNYAHLFGSTAPNGTFYQVLESEWIEDEYKEPLHKIILDLLESKTSNSMELRVKDMSGNYLWCRLHLVAISDPSGSLSTIIGCLQNIDEHKKYVNQLKILSERDGLTNIYNRVAMERIINDTIVTHNTGALGILDIDYFKQVNDINGHDFGDNMLINLAQQIDKILPKHVEFGRLGGDEFLIFVPYFISNSELDRLGQSIVKHIQDTFKNYDFPITVSLGFAQCDDNDSSFKTLYKRADIALYQAKNDGRNRFVVCSK